MSGVGAIVVESLRAAKAARASSALLITIAAGVCGAIVATTGQAAATERQVVERFEDAASRVLTVRSADPTTIDAELVASVARLSTVEAAVGLTAVGDGRNTAFGGGGDPVAVWRLTGAPGQLLPGFGELGEQQALATPQAAVRLGLEDGAGAADVSGGRTIAVRDVTEPDGSFAVLDPGLVLRDDAPETIERIHVVAADAPSAAALAAPVVALIDVPDPDMLSVETPAAFSDLEAIVAADLLESGRILLVGTLAVGALLIAGTVFGQVTLRRRDLGRRRALGANRRMLVGLVVVQTAGCTVVGALIGAAAGSVLVRVLLGDRPPLGFVLGTVALTVLAAALASVLPGAVAARGDPLAVLRTP